MWDGKERRKSPRGVCQHHSGIDEKLDNVKESLDKFGKVFLWYLGFSITGTLALIGWLLLMQRDIAQIYQRLPRLLTWLGF